MWLTISKTNILSFEWHWIDFIWDLKCYHFSDSCRNLIWDFSIELVESCVISELIEPHLHLRSPAPPAPPPRSKRGLQNGNMWPLCWVKAKRIWLFFVLVLNTYESWDSIQHVRSHWSAAVRLKKKKEIKIASRTPQSHPINCSCFSVLISFICNKNNFMMISWWHKLSEGDKMVQYIYIYIQYNTVNTKSLLYMYSKSRTNLTYNLQQSCNKSSSCYVSVETVLERSRFNCMIILKDVVTLLNCIVIYRQVLLLFSLPSFIYIGWTK